jgi:hypothetical protein
MSLDFEQRLSIIVSCSVLNASTGSIHHIIQSRNRSSVVGYLKKTKSSTQFLDGPKPLVVRMADMASASLPKTPPELAAPKGAL